MARTILVPQKKKKQLQEECKASRYLVDLALAGDDTSTEKKNIRKMAIKLGGAYVGK